MTDVKANGLRFNVVRLDPEETVDDAPTVVLIHGLIMDNLSSYFYTLAPGLAAFAHVVMYDLRGHGLSERPAFGYSVRDAVDDLMGLLDSLDVTESAYLVGNSFGGTIALQAAMEHPDRVAGIALIEAHPVIDGWGDEMVSQLEDIVSGFDDPGVREWITIEGGRKLRRMSETCEELINSSSMPDDLRAAPPTTAAELGAISCPTLCLYGQFSDILDRAQLIVDAVPGAQLRVLEGCSHSILMEAPDELEEHIVEWIGERQPVGGNHGGF
jgi:pimeloyl-ACP methyl ester carboxylesterase